MDKEIVLGNGAMARGIIENSCHMVYSYPGTPSSEILPEVVRYKKSLVLNTYIEWSVNEKVAFDNAFSASLTGKRSAVIMKQVGLNVASDSLMSSAYTGIKGGMLIISCDDPGPHSSQTEQDTRFFAMFAKVPVFDPSDPQEAKDMVEQAFELSEKYEIPVIMRATTRVCHAIQNINLSPVKLCERKANFKKDPERWAATPLYRYILHKKLNEKLENLSRELSERGDLNYTSFDFQKANMGIISSGVCYSVITDILKELGLENTIPVLKLGVVYPFPLKLVNDFTARCGKVLVMEETDMVIEMQVFEREKILGRSTGHVPREGELVPEIVYSIITSLAGACKDNSFITSVKKIVKFMNLPVRKPSLCPGCPHRASFYAIKNVFPNAIFPGDIGCYTLGINLSAVDTVLDMGASITMAGGFYQAYNQDGVKQPVVCTIGDSTFFHSGPSGLINGVYNKARFILVILDNEITAMTGMQPTPGTGILPDGTPGKSLSILEIVKGCGVNYVKEIDPYDMKNFISSLKDAGEYIAGDNGGIAVIISKHPCILNSGKKVKKVERIVFTEDCNGCRYCIKTFECPALIYNESRKKVFINDFICVNCGICAEVCPSKSIKIK